MNEDTLKGNWNKLKGEVQKQWGKLTNDELDQIRGNKDLLIGKLQDKYGYTQEQAKNMVDDWMRTSTF